MSLDKFQIAQRIANELKDGFYVNLGIGIPTLIANYIPENISVVLQSENGLLGMGPFPTKDNIDPDLINAGNQYNVEMLINRYPELSHTEIMFVYPDEFLNKIVPFFKEKLN